MTTQTPTGIKTRLLEIENLLRLMSAATEAMHDDLPADMLTSDAALSIESGAGRIAANAKKLAKRAASLSKDCSKAFDETFAAEWKSAA